jgi:uncharacterized protein YigE (DUF2233 family)
MIRLHLLIAVICGTASCLAGEYFRLDAPLGPGERNGTLHGYHFNQKTETLRVIDRNAATLAPWKSLGEAFSSVRALAGCNGGYTLPDGKPIGIVVSDSVRFGALETKPGPTSGLVLVKWNTISLLNAAHATEADLMGATQAIQGGPFLVENGRPAAGLDSKTYSRRTVLVTSGHGDWAILYAPSATFSGLANLLGDGKSFTKFPISAALNLDGGLSSGIWIHLGDGAPPVYLREVNPVRTGIAVVST